MVPTIKNHVYWAVIHATMVHNGIQFLQGINKIAKWQTACFPIYDSFDDMVDAHDRFQGKCVLKIAFPVDDPKFVFKNKYETVDGRKIHTMKANIIIIGDIMQI